MTACEPDEQKRLTVVAGCGLRDVRDHRGDARHVHAHAALGMTAAEDHVLDLALVEVGMLVDDFAHDMRRVVDGLREIE